MSCRNFNFDDCLDDSVEEFLDRDTSQASAQKRAEAHDKQLVAVAALAPITENNRAVNGRAPEGASLLHSRVLTRDQTANQSIARSTDFTIRPERTLSPARQSN